MHAGLYPQLLEAGGGAVGRALVVAEAHHLVEEVGERLVAELGAAFLEHLVNGLARHVELPAHAGRIALFPNMARHRVLPACRLSAHYVSARQSGSSKPGLVRFGSCFTSESLYN